MRLHINRAGAGWTGWVTGVGGGGGGGGGTTCGETVEGGRWASLSQPPSSTDAKYTHHYVRIYIYNDNNTTTVYICRYIVYIYTYTRREKNTLFSLSSRPLFLRKHASSYIILYERLKKKKRPLKIITEFDGYFFGLRRFFVIGRISHTLATTTTTTIRITYACIDTVLYRHIIDIKVRTR